MPPEISSNSLSNLVRLELKSKELTEVGDDFYKDVRRYIDTLRESLETETLKKNYKGISKLSSELESAEDNLRKIVEIRASKILRARAENYKGAIEGKMTPEEKVFYDRVSQILRNHMDSLITGSIILGEYNVEESANVKINPLTNEKDRKKVENERERIVYVYKDTPILSIAGKSMKLRREDILTIPEKYATILESQGLVKIIK